MDDANAFDAQYTGVATLFTNIHNHDIETFSALPAPCVGKPPVARGSKDQ